MILWINNEFFTKQRGDIDPVKGNMLFSEVGTKFLNIIVYDFLLPEGHVGNAWESSLPEMSLSFPRVKQCLSLLRPWYGTQPWAPI
jgi:hypothetical protein